MFKDERVDARFATFLQEQCRLAERGDNKVSEQDAAWFLDQLALHATRRLFIGTMIYGPFGCPSWLAEVLDRLVVTVERMTGRSFVDLVLTTFRETDTEWDILAASCLSGFSGRLNAAVESGSVGVFPTELIRAAQAKHAAFREKAFIAPRSIQEVLAGAKGLLDESLTLLALAESLSPGLTFERTNSGGYVAEGDKWISFKWDPENRQLRIALLGTVGDYQGRSELPLRKSNVTHVAFTLSEAAHLEAAQDYIRQAAGLRAAQ